MKNAIIFLAIFLFVECAIESSLVFVKVKYDVPMVTVERPVDIKQKYGDVETITLTKENKYFYSDSLIDATFVYLNEEIGFSILNKSNQTMKLIWDEAGLIEPDRSLTKIMHTGVKYSERNSSMPPSIIPRHGKLEDQAVPVNRISYKEGYSGNFQYASFPGRWESSGIFPYHTIITKDDKNSVTGDFNPVTDEDIKPFLEASKKYLGSKIGLLLPLQIEDVKNEYTFWFEVKDVKIDTTTRIKY